MKNLIFIRVVTLLIFSLSVIGTIQAQGCLITPSATSVETANDGTNCSYLITLCVDVPNSPSPKRIYFEIEYDSDGDGTLDATQSFEIDPPGSGRIEEGTYCHNFAVEDIACSSGVAATAIGYVGSGGSGSICTSYSSTGTTTTVSLPVELTHFDARNDKGINILEWSTATEKNTRIFVVEHSPNGIDGFVAVGEVEAEGHSTRKRDYIFRHDSKSTFNYYRLRIIDFDGYTEFSDVIFVASRKVVRTAIEIFPNPVFDKVNIGIERKGTDFVEVQLTNMQGSILRNELISGESDQINLSWNVGDLAQGIYNITINNGTEIISKKMLKIE